MADILTYRKPKPTLDAVFIADLETDLKEGVKPSKIAGHFLPMVSINGYNIELNELQSFSLNCDSFVPTVSVSFFDNSGHFSTIFYPKDGDVISVYIKSNTESKFRSIRCDFNISDFSPGTEGYFTAKGIMRIPLLTAEHIGVYEGTSMQALMKASEELNLGFASNVEVTSDLMKWVNANDSRLRFMESVISRAWLDKDSHFRGYIDIHYHLCLVELARQFIEPKKIERSILSFSERGDIMAGSEDDKGVEVELILSNHPRIKGTSNYVQKWSLFNATHSANIAHGYIRVADWYDWKTAQKSRAVVDPIVPDDRLEDSQVQKGRPGDMSYKGHVKYKYLGLAMQGGGMNTHENYKLAEIHNLHNNIFCDRMGIRFEIDSINAHLYRYQQIPIVIWDTNRSRISALKERDKAVGELDENDQSEEETRMKVNKIVSGYYVIRDINYRWDTRMRNIQMEVVAIRRDWPFQFPKDRLGKVD